MERKMRRDPALRQKYIEFMREYIQLGHMSVSSLDWRCVEHYYIPHLAVLKSPEAKIRVVFDGSAPTSNGVSVNQCLHAGPKLNRDIVDILTDFRLHQVAFVADVKMMFRQTMIHPDDRRYQLILWRESPDEPMVTYELNTVTYGLKPSPYLAVRTLRELAAQERVRYPRAAAVLDRDVYVDDICTGADSVEQALILRDELIAIMGSGGYELRKWLSSCPELLAGLPGEFHQDPHLFENPDNPNTLGILGVQYRPTHDVFTYKIEPDLWRKLGLSGRYCRQSLERSILADGSPRLRSWRSAFTKVVASQLRMGRPTLRRVVEGLAQVCDHLTRDCAHRDTPQVSPIGGM
ncbi:hypothetical protein NE865_06178 [Phthorimaea operculella]|nr:hypothetical protein NE865_06178 [Phthorimaea operculella]